METSITKPKTSPKDFFLHLLVIGTLYFSAISFGTLIFQFINIYVPDAIDKFSSESSFRSVRFAISSLIVIFPVFIYSSWLLNKEYKKNPLKLNLGVRKWLLYLTLFLASIIVIVDLVTLINSLLSGELTVRFALKVSTVLFIAGSVFWYYLNDLRGGKVSHSDQSQI